MLEPLRHAARELGERYVDWRTRPRVVLWGGKPGRDIAYNGEADRVRQHLIGAAPAVRVFVDAAMSGIRALAEFERRLAAAALRAEKRTQR